MSTAGRSGNGGTGHQPVPPDPLIPIYNRRLDYYSPLIKHPAARLAGMVGVTLEPVTLDVGCGVGWSAEHLPAVVGLDYAEQRITRAQHRYPSHEWHHTDAHQWLTETGRVFGSALIVEVLEHVPDPKRLLALVAAVTDGPIVATVPIGIEEETHRHMWYRPTEPIELFQPDTFAVFGLHVVMGWQVS